MLSTTKAIGDLTVEQIWPQIITDWGFWWLFDISWWKKCVPWPNYIIVQMVAQFDCKILKYIFAADQERLASFGTTGHSVGHCKFLLLFQFVSLTYKELFRSLSNRFRIDVHFVRDFSFWNIRNASTPLYGHFAFSGNFECSFEQLIRIV